MCITVSEDQLIPFTLCINRRNG